ncbi:MAG: thioredoxin family protein [Ruminococcus sp.]|nr:thioredoxin family protein [Ruminococcus sp.]MDO4419166.1 thioredoxin family protein [Ruminococcus sp.]
MEILNTEDFREKVFFEDKRCAVLFTAPWCGFCRSMKLMVEKAERDFGLTQFYTVDIDKEPSLKTAFGISAVPTIIVFEDGKPLNKATGLLKKSELYTLLGAELMA